MRALGSSADFMTSVCSLKASPFPENYGPRISRPSSPSARTPPPVEEIDSLREPREPRAWRCAMALIDDDENDVIAELERIDRFFGGEEAGDIPLEVLRARGMDIPQAPPDDAAALRSKLMEIVEGMYEIGIVVEETDHLSDAELYRFLIDDALLQETIISVGGGG